MAIEIIAPESFDKYWNDNHVLIFAGGTIEMNTAVDWQKELPAMFAKCDDVVILNPRRKKWNAAWKQTIGNKHFRQQVEWELDGLESSDFIILNLIPGTLSPISMLELGLFVADYTCSEPKLHVICPKGFWRKGNIDIVCRRYGIPMFSTLEAAVERICTKIDRTVRDKRAA